MSEPKKQVIEKRYPLEEESIKHQGYNLEVQFILKITRLLRWFTLKKSTKNCNGK